MYDVRVKRRPYQKVMRAEAEQATRARIVDALMALHEEVGPSRTTVSAVAERAGVERLTVYRHFADEASMIRACSTCWNERNPAPPVPETSGRDAVAECRRALLDLYSWYRKNARMLANVLADAVVMPVVQESMAPMAGYLDAFATALDRQWPRRNTNRLNTLRHAVQFTTWQSLTSMRGSDRRAVDLAISWFART